MHAYWSGSTFTTIWYFLQKCIYIWDQKIKYKKLRHRCPTKKNLEEDKQSWKIAPKIFYRRWFIFELFFLFLLFFFCSIFERWINKSDDDKNDMFIKSVGLSKACRGQNGFMNESINRMFYSVVSQNRSKRQWAFTKKSSHVVWQWLKEAVFILDN